ncbi:hypothetical protein ACQY0O_004057 [Thecaphora frezii]
MSGPPTTMTTTTTAVASPRDSYDADGTCKLDAPDAMQEMEEKLRRQLELNLARRGASPCPVGGGEGGAIDTPTTLAGSVRASLDSDDKKQIHLATSPERLEEALASLPSAGEGEPAPAPDGGFKAWLVVAGTFLMIMTNFGLLTSYGVFQTYYVANQLRHLAPSTVSWIGSIQTFCIFFGSFFFGKLCDDFGPRWILIVGSVMTFVSLLLVSFCYEFYQFVLAQGLLFGIGGSMLFLPSCAIVGQYFDKRRGLAMGIIIGAASFGGIVWPLVLSALFASPKLGFEWGTRISALLLAGLLALSNAVMKPRLKPNRSLSSGSGAAAKGTQPASLPWKSAYQVFANVDYTIFVIGIFFMWINFFVPYFQISSYAKMVGFDTNMASRCITIMNTASLFGRILSGPLADRWGRFNCLFIFGLLSSVSLLLLWPIPGLTDTRAGVMLLSVFYGLFSGGSIAIASACCAQLSTPRELGTRLGMLWTSAAPGLLIGPVVATKLVAAMHGSYLGLAMWAGLLSLFGVAFIGLARYRLAKGKWFIVV